MNNPEYIIVDVIGEVVAAIKAQLELPVLNYQYGYVRELNETLIQWNQNPEYAFQRFPLIWLSQPFTVLRGGERNLGYYGRTTDMKIFILHHSTKTMKAEERMAANYKPIIYPIYRALINQLAEHQAFGENVAALIEHQTTDRYYWGEDQQSVLNDVVDCLIVSDIALPIHNNENCLPNFKSF